MVIFSVLSPLKEISCWFVHDLWCKNEISIPEWALKHGKKIYMFFDLGTAFGAWLGIGSHPTSDVAEGGPAGHHTSCPLSWTWAAAIKTGPAHLPVAIKGHLAFDRSPSVFPSVQPEFHFAYLDFFLHETHPTISAETQVFLTLSHSLALQRGCISVVNKSWWVLVQPFRKTA